MMIWKELTEVQLQCFSIAIQVTTLFGHFLVCVIHYTISDVQFDSYFPKISMLSARERKKMSDIKVVPLGAQRIIQGSR